jgi:hypothetical protein
LIASRLVALVLGFAFAFALASPASGFQRETTDDPHCREDVGVNCPHRGTPLRWLGIPVLFHVNSANSDVDPGTAENAIRAAFATWQAASSDGILFEFAGGTTAGANGMDDTNVFLWQSLSSTSDTFAQSILTYDVNSGEILDVDVQLNSNFTWAVLVAGEDDPVDQRVDIQAVATHEAGHLLGLAHENRFGPGVVMFFSDTFGNTSHRNLSDDDRAGVRAIYASGSGGGGGGGGKDSLGCAIGETKGSGDLASLALVLAAFGLARRLRKGRSASSRGA